MLDRNQISVQRTYQLTPHTSEIGQESEVLGPGVPGGLELLDGFIEVAFLVCSDAGALCGFGRLFGLRFLVVLFKQA